MTEWIVREVGALCNSLNLNFKIPPALSLYEYDGYIFCLFLSAKRMLPLVACNETSGRACQRCDIYIYIYSKTPIYRASRGKGKNPGKSGDTVNRGTEKIVQNSAYLMFRIINYAMHLHT
jgi:hypothetical protein